MDRDTFNKMLLQMDSDGNGTVDQTEFVTAFRLAFPGEDAEATWTQIDKDKDGTLTLEELAEYYGFNMENDTAVEMDDEQILNALRLASAAAEKAAAEKRVVEEAAAAEEDAEAKVRNKVDRVELSANGKDAKEIDQIYLLQACQLGDLKKDDSGKNPITVQALLDKAPAVQVRVEDEKWETALHKLARVGVAEKNMGCRVVDKKVWDDCFDRLIAAMREQGGKLGKDVNHQARDGKTPLHLAVEYKHTHMIDKLYALNTEGPDSLLVNSVGQTIMHVAVFADDLSTLKHLAQHISQARLKALLFATDKTFREPAHIAAYHSEDASGVVEWLSQNGAKNTRKDASGHLPADLAAKSGRKKSKEILESILP